MAALPAAQGGIPPACGLLIVDHGSRRSNSNEQLVAIRDMVRSLTKSDPRVQDVAHAHMEIADPSIEETVARLKRKGAKNIHVLPYFLSRGRHVAVDIPSLVKAACKKYAVPYKIAPALGPHPDLSQLLLTRANARSGTPLIVVDHGSKRPQSNKQLLSVVDGVRRLVLGRNKVHHAHMEIAPPSIEDSVRKIARGGGKSVHVLPYFLSPGRHTTTDIPALVKASAVKYNLHHTMSPPLGPHPILARLLLKQAFPNYTPPALKKGDWRSRHGPESAYPTQPKEQRILRTLFRELTAKPADSMRIAVGLTAMIASKDLGVRSAVALRDAVDSVKKENTPVEHLMRYMGYKVAASLLQESKDLIFGPVAQSVRRRVMRKGYEKLQSLDHEFLSARSHGSLTRVLQRGERALDRVGAILVFQFIPTFVELLMVSRALRSVGPQYAARTLTMAGVYGLWSVPSTHFRAKFKKVMNHSEDLSAVRATDALQNHELVKLEGTRRDEVKKFDAAQQLYSTASLNQQRCLAAIRTGQRLVFAGSLSSLMALAATGVTTGDITLGDLLLTKTLMTQLTRPMELLGAYYRELQSGIADLRQLFTFIRQQPSIVDGPLKDLPEGSPVLKLKNVSYKYPKNEDRSLKNVSLECKAGEVIAVVGESGSGKTTLTRLIPRLVDPCEGSVEVNGVDVKRVVVEGLRKKISVIPQGNTYMRDTIRNNICYGLGEQNNETLLAAVKKAALEPVIKKTGLSENMMSLSGGERQRVALARSFLKNAPLVVLDEPTSSLDKPSTAKVFSSLLNARSANKATVIIAHHLPNPHLLTRIYVLKKGRIIAEGTHAHLMKTCEHYKQLRSLSLT